MKAYGRKAWLVADAFWPEVDNGAYNSHESVCVLNTGANDAHMRITLFFEDRPAMGCFEAVCMAGRTNHVRMDKIRGAGGEAVPKGVPYAIMVESDEDVVVQYTRLDTTQPELSLMTAMAWPVA
ncbi:MAG: sensory rhodopsin transducer [Oscillospiraceae bacterium]|nr:sensory rhodopsin transducer [Oscillospiraceae bacterium]